MNQYIKIRYKVFSSNPNLWIFWFVLNKKSHREKVPSDLNSYGDWGWHIQNKFQKSGTNGWNNQ